ncbi:MAG TPA: chromate resistance protein ChrB domain-containing protein [Gemmatimonadaceae bacterium]|jgi:hypothetical protein
MVNSVSQPWLLFLPQLPAKPDYARVKLWRRLQPLGAVALRGGVYVLPNTAEAREDLEWVGKEVEADGGSAIVCESVFSQAVSDELRARFRERVTHAYRQIAADSHEALGDREGAQAAARRLRRQLNNEVRRDHFGAEGRDHAEHALAQLETALSQKDAASTATAGPRAKGAVWVTRAGVFVDRIASAWLIRRFIDTKAHFKFVTGTRHAPHPNEIRFDMFQGEYTHRGERCTFEVLLQEFSLTNRALAAIAEIVHDIDLKDGRYQRPETDGIALLLQGLVLAEGDDGKRLKAGAQIFDILFAQLSATHP